MKTKDILHIQKELVQWYIKDHRQLPWRETDDPYHIWVSEVMLQQTQVKTVLPYYKKFLHSFPDLKSLMQADLQEVLKVWEGLGYYARAKNLHQAAKIVMDEYKGQIPDNFKEFRKLPGVGEYIASAVQSIAFHHPYAVTDGNVKRVLARLCQSDAPVNHSASHKIFKEIANQLIVMDDPATFNQAIMELGAMLCKPGKPLCHLCPLSLVCMAYQNQKTDMYPKRIQSKSVPQYQMVAGVIYKDAKILITKRPSDGLLGGLWEFPGGKVREDEETEDACVREIKEAVGLSVEILSHLTCVKHAYTHFRIVMDVFVCNYVSGKVKLNTPVDYRWVMPHEAEQYPFPKAHHKVISLINLVD